LNVKLITMSEIEVQPVRWLWYPYVPYGKVTLVQGDPGDGNDLCTRRRRPALKRNPHAGK